MSAPYLEKDLLCSSCGTEDLADFKPSDGSFGHMVRRLTYERDEAKEHLAWLTRRIELIHRCSCATAHLCDECQTNLLKLFRLTESNNE